MITREEATALLAHAPDYWMAPGDGSIENVQGATIAHVHEHANLRTVDRTRETHSAADARLLAAAPDLARTVVALYDERDALALELRRLRAAEAPGTDDAAFEGTGWVSQGPDAWRHFADGRHSIPVWRDGSGRWLRWGDGSASVDEGRLALDAMRAAVPGSV